MNRRSQKVWAAAFLVLCLVAACLLPLGTAYFVSAEEVCTHEHGVFLMTKQATCIEEGYSLYYCPDCGEDYTIDIPGLADHQYWSVYSVFSKDGELVEDHVHCSICGHEDILYFDGGSDTPMATNGNTLPGWAIALIVITALLAVGGVATGIALYWKKSRGTTKHRRRPMCGQLFAMPKNERKKRLYFLGVIWGKESKKSI